MMDCNGHSPKYHDVKVNLGGGCTDPGVTGAGRFEDNGVYVGHDEPSVKFISSAPGSGNNMTYVMRLARDPKGKPTVSPNGKTVSDYAELSPAPWFGLPICDPGSYPQNPCKPDSDSNSGAINDPNARARRSWKSSSTARVSAVRRLAQLRCQRTGVPRSPSTASSPSSTSPVCNTACEEPTNFAFPRRDGAARAPGSQLADVSTSRPMRRRC